MENINTDLGDPITMAEYGAADVVNPDYNQEGHDVGEVGSLSAPEVSTGSDFLGDSTFTADAVNNSLELGDVNQDNYPNGMNSPIAAQLFQEVLNQACAGCHLKTRELCLIRKRLCLAC